ncbi:MAG: DUF2911 domain-containing protein [Saprospiraceae bacterium]
MKRLFTIAVLTIAAFLTFDLNGQIKTPAPSPAASFTQTVGLTEVVIVYSRPSVKGRKIFATNGLVPYGKTWRTGANQATKITFSEDVTVEGKSLEAGSYAMFTVPGAASWDVMFFEHTTTNSGGYGDATPAAKVTVTPTALPFSVESFFITLANIKSDGALLEIIWDNVLVPIKLGVNTDKAVMANIDRVLAGPSGNDYYAAGIYMFTSGKNANKALELVQKATSQGEPKFWQKKWEAEILAAVGRKKDAIKTAKLSKELATKAGNDNYVKMNVDNIAKWSM